MQGKTLYDRIREFAHGIDWDDTDTENQEATMEEAATLGLQLLADIGESLAVSSGRVEDEA